jgi:hypothetical protein
MAAKRKAAARKRPAAKKRPSAKKRATKHATGKRELIDTGTNRLYVRRNKRDTSFTEVVDEGRSLAADRRQHAKREVRSGYGDRGDR